jgi:hypothetical protein
MMAAVGYDIEQKSLAAVPDYGLSAYDFPKRRLAEAGEEGSDEDHDDSMLDFLMAELFEVADQS